MKKDPLLLGHNTIHILLVDDNKHGLVARRNVLEAHGFSVSTATSGEEALELFSPGRYQLIITDYKMPMMSGAELIKNIRKAEPNARIILLSGFVDPLGLSEQSTGADMVLAKSAREVERLLWAITRLLSHRTSKKPPGTQKSLVRSQSTGSL